MAGATRDQILTAARELKEQGLDPTYRRVREHLGGGSYATIARALRDLSAEERAGSPEVAEEIPDAFVNIGREVTRRAWTAAREWGHELAEAERRAAEARGAEASELLAQAEAQIEEMEGDLAVARAEIERLTRALADSQRAEAEARGALAQAQRVEEIVRGLATRPVDQDEGIAAARRAEAEAVAEAERLRTRVEQLTRLNANMAAESEREAEVRAAGQNPARASATGSTTSRERRKKKEAEPVDKTAH